jgi:hypothetical protein
MVLFASAFRKSENSVISSAKSFMNLSMPVARVKAALVL